MHRRTISALLVVLVVGLAACSGDDPAATATAAVSATPIAVPATPTPTPTPTPAGTVAPLTGESVAGEDLGRPALSAKIENTRAAQPQAGLEDADLVFEELVEGGITRFLAVFHSTVPAQIGPIRSARLVDADLLPAFDGVLVYSGGRPDVEAAISGTALLLTEGDPGVYRVADRPRPRNLFADGVLLYDEALMRDPSLAAPPSAFVFVEEPPAGDCPACDGDQLSITFSPAAVTGWQHDPEAGVYRRSQGTTPQPTASGAAVGAANVVAVAVSTVEGGCCDTNGAPYVISRTTGEGRAIVLRDGRRYEARWQRESTAAPWTLTLAGQPLPLSPGPTWIHLVPEEEMPSAPDEVD